MNKVCYIVIFALCITIISPFVSIGDLANAQMVILQSSGSSGGNGTPSLQQVTDIGNHTTNSIDFAGGTVTATLYLDADLFTDRWSSLQENTVIGVNAAGDGNMTGDDNSLFGYIAGQALTVGQDNTMIGRGAGASSTDADLNVFLGRNTGNKNIEGKYNTFLGAKAGESGTDVSGSVFIGYDVGSDETTDNKLYIDNSNTPNPLIWGDFSTNEIVINGTASASTVLQDYVWHAYGGFQNKAEVISITAANSWSWVTNAGNNLWSGAESYGMSLTADVMTIDHTGDYFGSLSMTISGLNGKDFQIRLYNITDSAQVGNVIGASTTSVNNFVNITLPLYIENTAGDTYRIEITCNTDGTDPILRSSVFYMTYLHN